MTGLELEVDLVVQRFLRRNAEVLASGTGVGHERD